MAGHSKWHNIQHRKGAQDAKRGKIFTKLIREIVVAAKMGGEQLDSNPRLRTAIDKALAENMTKDTINRAVARGAGGGEGSDMQAVRYEGYGPHGVAVLVECLTDNKNRSVAQVRHAFTKHQGNLGTDGSVAYLFDKRALLVAECTLDNEALMEGAIEAGVEEFELLEPGVVEFLADASAYHQVLHYFQQQSIVLRHHDMAYLASTQTPLDEEQAQMVIALIDQLEECDDVQSVHTNAQFPEQPEH